MTGRGGSSHFVSLLTIMFAVACNLTFMNSTLLSRGASLRKTNRKFSSSGRIILANWKTCQRAEVRAEWVMTSYVAFHLVILFLKRTVNTKLVTSRNFFLSD